MPSDESPIENEVRQFLLENYADLIAKVLASADATSQQWSGAAPNDRTEFVPQFQRQLAREGVLSRLPKSLREAAQAADLELSAEPVAAPPYVVVTSTGVILRGTAQGGRLVITFRTFAVRRGNQVRYERVNNDVTSAVEVAFVPR